MTGKVYDFEAWHAAELVAKHPGAPSTIVTNATDEAKSIEGTGMAWTLIDEDGVQACGGISEQWPGRYQAWMHFAPGAGRHMFHITREVLRRLNTTPGRVEMTVVADYDLGHRWAKMLGFEVENPPGILKGYGLVGEDHVSYVRFAGE